MLKKLKIADYEILATTGVGIIFVRKGPLDEFGWSNIDKLISFMLPRSSKKLKY